MPERRTREANLRETSLARGELRLTWHLDPATGKPVARRTVERPKLTRNILLRVAA